ncbi:MAG: hypothetical protein WD887_01170 [Candidatus Saccharimonadales bacterium]
MKRFQKGFSVVELLLIIVVVTGLAYVGYRVYDRQQTRNAAASEQSPTARDVSSAPEIKKASDLDAASKLLDQNDPAVSNQDASQLDSELSNF